MNEKLENRDLGNFSRSGNKSNNSKVIVITLLFSAWVFFFTDIYLVSKLGLILFVIIVLRFIDVIGKYIAVRELISLIVVLQMIVTPIIKYNYLGNDLRYTMEMDEQLYMNFVLLATVLFIIGLFIATRRGSSTQQYFQQIESNKIRNGKIGTTLIIVGFLAILVTNYVPSTLQFVVVLFATLRFIGSYYMIFSNHKYRWVWLAAVYGSYVYTAIGSSLFINLFIWGLFLFIITSFHYKFTFLVKLLILCSGFYIAFIIQTFKKEYRQVVWMESGNIEHVKSLKEGEKTNQGIFLEMMSERMETEELDDYGDIHKFVDRLNQGWILALVMNQVPKNEPFSNGVMIKEDITSAFVPRILNPTKRSSGGEYGRQKFMQYTGKYIGTNTRMTIGTYGDAYVNFGITGGIIFMFALGLLFNIILKLIYSLALTKYPTLLFWIPFIFFYAMRSGNEFLMILNYITKSSLIVFAIFYIFKNAFRTGGIKVGPS